MKSSYLSSAIRQFEYYKSLGDKTFAQISDDAFLWQANEESNSIATIVKHLWGNMLSRWTDFMTSDGEKEFRKRDAEFENDLIGREAILEKWEEGWACCLNAIRALQDEDIEKIIYIRNQGHTVTEAINRQMSHYAYHVGQIVFLGKMVSTEDWQSLSIPKGGSRAFNQDKFSQEKKRGHFTDDSKT